jgi:HlyD family secretion protein
MANRNSNGSNGNDGRPWLAILLIVLVIFVSAGTIFELRPHRIRISVIKPQKQSLSNSITTNGKVEPVYNFEAHAPAAGTVQKVLVKEGTQVKTGQLLMVLDDTKARSDLALAQTRLKAAQAGYATLIAGGNQQQILARQADLQKAISDRDTAERQLEALKRLQQRGAASADEVQAVANRLAHTQADLAQLQAQVRYSPEERARSQSEVADAKASVELAEETVRSCNVRAPFDGTVYFLPARAGAWVNVGDLLLQEADLSQLRVRAFVDEPEIGRLALGQRVNIEWDALAGHVWQGTVATLPSTVVNRGSRVVGEVLCNVDNSEHLLLPSINVTTTIVASSRENTLTVPREAVHEESGRNYIFVVNEHKLQRREIKLGISNLTRVEVLSGISENDTIAVQSYSPSPMSDGIAVKIIENPLQ